MDDHAWNAVVIGDAHEWRLIDATWGAGYLKNNSFEKRFTSTHFLVHLNSLSTPTSLSQHTPTSKAFSRLSPIKISSPPFFRESLISAWGFPHYITPQGFRIVKKSGSSGLASVVTRNRLMMIVYPLVPKFSL
ncbi:hypothetical protein BC829DRAFT_302199 [Chytridium lagenaria]|nr:hypothetical protein BC829DRAFT_302199 [Chytridium lagenaria]